MLARNVRLRKEYLYRKSLEEKEASLLEKKRKLKDALENGKSIPTEIRGADRSLRRRLDLLDENSWRQKTHVDDEYGEAGVADPKIVITTCRSPSTRLTKFAKEVRLIFPNAQRINRGHLQMHDLAHLCHLHQITDLIILHENKGVPNGLVICHFPFGPTAYFSLKNVVMRHDLPDKPPHTSEANPHLIFHAFTTKLGMRVMNILRYLFPPSSPQNSRCISFINNGDEIHFRNHVFQLKKRGEAAAGVEAEGHDKEKEECHEFKEGVRLLEQGPRFSLILYKIDLGVIGDPSPDLEFTLRPFLNSKKPALHQDEI